MTPGEWASIIGAVIALATFARLLISEAARAKRQLDIVTNIIELRKEISDAYVTCKVFELRSKAVDQRFDATEGRLVRLEPFHPHR
jgi:hypothetical protein